MLIALAFIAGGTIAGAGVSTTVGGMGLAGGFGAVGIGTVVSGGKSGTIKIWRQTSASDESILEFVPSGEWWEVLGVEKTDNPKDVKRTYLRLVRLYHPDVNSSSNAKAGIQAINRAYREYRQKVNALNFLS